MTTAHVIFSGKDIEGLASLGISRVMVEVSPTGNVLREIGFDSSDRIVYRFPGQGHFGECGLFDNQTIGMPSRSDLSLEEFNALFDAV